MSDRFTLQFARDAKKSLAELQPKQFKQIATKIFALLDNPQPQDFTIAALDKIGSGKK